MARLRKRHIFVIDDDPETLNLLALALRRKKFDVTTAMTWENVIEEVKQCYKHGSQFDAIMLDLMMPDRSGFDVLLSLQTMLVPLPPVIVLTAVTDISKQIQAGEMGVKKYLTKPTTPKKLVETLDDIFD